MSMTPNLAAPRCVSNWERYSTPLLTVLLASALLLPLLGFATGQPWRLAVALIIAPLAEEVIFRLGLHEALLRRKVSPFKANLVVALAFGVAHLTVRGDVTAMLVVGPALLLGVVYGRKRSLGPCVGLHAAMNLIWLCCH